MTLSDLYTGQKALHQEAFCLLENLSKLGAKKTEKIIAQKKLDLDRIWKEFEENNSKIKTHPEATLADDYSTNGLYEKMSLLIKNGNRKMEEYSMRILLASNVQPESLVSDIEQKRRYIRQNARMSSIQRIAEMDTDGKNSAWFEQQIKSVENYWNRFSTEHEEIISNVCADDEQNEYHEQSIYQFLEDLVNDTLAKFHTCSRSNTEVRPACELQKIKLPAIEIPKFNGNLNNWSSFFDLFSRTIHQNATLNDAQRMQYLDKTFYH